MSGKLLAPLTTSWKLLSVMLVLVCSLSIDFGFNLSQVISTPLNPFSQIFGGNMDIKTERRHYLNVPMVTRYLRIHPLTWRKRIGLRAGAIGCHHEGEECGPGFLLAQPSLHPAGGVLCCGAVQCHRISCCDSGEICADLCVIAVTGGNRRPVETHPATPACYSVKSGIIT